MRDEFGIDPAHAAQKACKRAIRRELGECHLGKAGNVSVAHPFRGQQSARKEWGSNEIAETSFGSRVFEKLPDMDHEKVCISCMSIPGRQVMGMIFLLI